MRKLKIENVQHRFAKPTDGIGILVHSKCLNTLNITILAEKRKKLI